MAHPSGVRFVVVGALLLAPATPVETAAAQTAPVVEDNSFPAWTVDPPLGLQVYMRIPDDNPLTREKVELGRRLFEETALSADRSVSCASCHRPERAFADSVARSIGVHGRRPVRNTPSILNAGYGKSFFWDGRVDQLEEQVLRPVSHPNEMGLPVDSAVVRLGRTDSYIEAFRTAFAGDITLRSGDSPADRFAAGDLEALDPDARAGYRIFTGKGNCTACHAGPLLTDERFHNTGVSRGGDDPGRHAVTGEEVDRGRFNTPSLRNVARTAPYMHDGSLATLADVIEFYDRGGVANPNLDPEIRPLRLTTVEKAQLEAYLRSLTGTR
jgi:cytochrome c peroxidase